MKKKKEKETSPFGTLASITNGSRLYVPRVAEVVKDRREERLEDSIRRIDVPWRRGSRSEGQVPFAI